MEEGYSICFNKWALDKSIKNELGLLLIISSLSAKEGYCYASNNYLANLFDTNSTVISKKIQKLKNKNYITIKYKKKGKEIISREIYLVNTGIVKNDKRVLSNLTRGIVKNAKDNNINNNNINIIKLNDFSKDELDNLYEN